MTAKRITIEGFLDEFNRRHEQLEDRPFCWILGSGASIQSGIPTGSALVEEWLRELHKLEDFERLPFDQWATAGNLEIPNFTYEHASNFYPWVYHRRFRDYKEQGYAFLESAMEKAEPSFGYSVLAQIMATTFHKVAITTNFDNLIADALSIYTRTFPLVCGHESLTGYIRANLRRPLIAKIHRDLLLAPLSNPEEIANLPGEWATALTKILDRFTPIVIGYGGNDGSLMGFLEALSPIEGGIFWCYREGGEIDAKIHNIVERHHGRLVPIAGFDEVMLQLQEKLKLPFLLPQLQRVHDKRVTNYQKQFELLTKTLTKPAASAEAEEARKPARQAAEAAVERLTKEKDWWAWQLKANAESDPQKCEAIYRAALEDFPKSSDLTGNFAVFMQNILKNSDEAERLYRKALELDPNDAIHTGNFAVFMQNVRSNFDEAERLYLRSLELDPNDAFHTYNCAVFMNDVRQNYDEAERLYRRAVELDPSDANHLRNLGLFLQNTRENYDEAEKLFRKGLKLFPNNADTVGALAYLLDTKREKFDEAERLYRKAVKLDPDDALNVGNLAVFLEGRREKFDEAERLYRKALKIDPNNATNVGNFAEFLESKRQSYDEAERLYKQAVKLDPANEWVANHYKQFRQAHRSRKKPLPQ